MFEGIFILNNDEDFNCADFLTTSLSGIQKRCYIVCGDVVDGESGLC